jgi:hypothetical protein
MWWIPRSRHRFQRRPAHPPRATRSTASRQASRTVCLKIAGCSTFRSMCRPRPVSRHRTRAKRRSKLRAFRRLPRRSRRRRHRPTSMPCWSLAMRCRRPRRRGSRMARSCSAPARPRLLAKASARIRMQGRAPVTETPTDKSRRQRRHRRRLQRTARMKAMVRHPTRGLRPLHRRRRLRPRMVLTVRPRKLILRPTPAMARQMMPGLRPIQVVVRRPTLDLRLTPAMVRPPTRALRPMLAMVRHLMPDLRRMWAMAAPMVCRRVTPAPARPETHAAGTMAMTATKATPVASHCHRLRLRLRLRCLRLRPETVSAMDRPMVCRLEIRAPPGRGIRATATTVTMVTKAILVA